MGIQFIVCMLIMSVLNKVWFRILVWEVCNGRLILQTFALLVNIANLLKCCSLQGHEAWIQDVCFGSNKKWIVTCAKVVNPCDTILSMLTQTMLLSLHRMVWWRHGTHRQEARLQTRKGLVSIWWRLLHVCLATHCCYVYTHIYTRIHTHTSGVLVTA